ncbi:MAG: hypothetical protein ACJ8MO_34525, partial [Bacillus sp. (in: firmicutes)]
MGLFINNNDHPEVYKNNQQLQTTNQAVSRKDFLSELIHEQQNANAALHKALSELGVQSQIQEETQYTQWNHVGEQLKDLRTRLDRYEDANYQLVLQMNKQLELQKEVSEKMT